ncbi:hypothetical protein BDY24DRAFT_389003 [Mrakia frigida]|uniref:uncharacterized protein n=1 Tax=Mrakia frigida TaxID=29902 RepID=UPI003FCC2406
MPVGGPSSGFGGNIEDRFAGRPVPPKASKSRKLARVQYQEAGEGDDGSSRGGEEDDDDLDPMTGKKRKRQRAGPGGDSLTCHQCRGYYETGLRCSMNKLSAKGKVWKQCILVYCDRDVMYRYGVDPEAIRNGLPPSEEDVRIGHHSSEARYKWTCPSCENICQCSICRKKNGLEPVGNLSIKTKNSGKRTAADLLKNGPGKGNKKFGSERGGTPIAEDLSHLSVEERTKYLKERERKIKLIAVAQDRLEKLKTDVEAVTIEDVGVRFEEGREAWEVEGDEGVAGRVELREFFWRFRNFVPLPDKVFPTLDNFDKPIAESTAKKMAVMMIDCLYSQILKGSPPVGETPEAIAEELAVQKRIEVILADVKAALKPTTSAHHLRKTLHALLVALEHAEQPTEFLSPSPRASMEGSIAPTEQDDIVEDKIETEKEVEEAPVASSSKLEEPVMEEVVEEAIVHPAPSTPGGTDLTLPTTNSLLILLSHRVLMSPDVRFDMEEGLAERAEMIKLQGREVRAFVEGRGKKRLKLEAEMAVALGAAAKGEKLAEIDDLPREDYLEHLRLVTSQRLALHGVAGRSAAVLGVDAEDRIYVSLAPDWEGRKPTGWGVGIHVFGKGFDSVWPSSSNGKDTGTLVSSTNASLEPSPPSPPKESQPKKDEHFSLSPASTVEAATSSEPTSSQWHHFPTHQSIRHLADVVAFQALNLAFERGDLILTVHLPTSTSPSQRVYPEDAWYHSSTNLGEFAEEGKVKELLTRMNEVADLLEVSVLEDEEEAKLIRLEESCKAKEKAKEVEEPLGKRRRKSKP